MTGAIEAESLSKSFGETKSVDGITFSVEESEIYGFLGSNGAGKSTTMMMLTTLLRPTSSCEIPKATG
jgi:ABC-2 type transport system ATP-binding protein